MSNDMRPGWFAVKRGITNHPIFHKRPDRAFVWLWMLETAAYQDTRQDAGGKPVSVKRGQVLTSFRQIESATGVSVKIARGLIDLLKAERAIDIDTGTGRMLITICNYEKYQSGPDDKGTDRGTARAQQGHTKETSKQIPPTEDAASPVLKSVDADPINKAVWDFGVPFLQANGVKNPRPIIGGWLRDHPNPMAVLEALRDAQKAGTADPVPYIKAVLQNSTRRKPQWHRGQHRVLSNGRVQEFDGQRWDFRNDLTAEDVAHAV